MKWKQPPIIKIYEALGALADGRIEVSGNSAKVFSSSGNKFYTVQCDPEAQAIMVNDNGSYFRGYLGYPAIAFLMSIGEIEYSGKVADMLKDVPWKDINQKYKNDFEKTLAYILKNKSEQERTDLEKEAYRIDVQLRSKSFSLLGKKIKPPEGY